MFALIKKELKVHFATPIGAVSFALFLFLTGFVFTVQMTRITPQNLPEASLRGMMYFISVTLLFLSPFLTMKSFAEERKSGTMELLKTSPLSDLQIVLGKYLSMLFLLSLLLALTIEFPVFLMISGEPDPGPLLTAYLGLFLMGAAFLAVGLFCSSLTRNQMIAAILTFTILLTLWFVEEIGGQIGEALSPIRHIEAFGIGVLDLLDVSYYLILILLFLFFTVRRLNAERWS